MNLLERRVPSKNLYLITLKKVANLSLSPLSISFYPCVDNQYAFAKKGVDGYRDVFTKEPYHTYDEPSICSGDWIISVAQAVQSDYKFIPESILKEELSNLNATPLPQLQKIIIKK